MEEEQEVVSEKDEDNEDELNIEANVEENSELLEIICGENSNRSVNRIWLFNSSFKEMFLWRKKPKKSKSVNRFIIDENTELNTTDDVVDNIETQKNDDAITTFEANVEEYSELLEIISGENSNESVNQIWLFNSSFKEMFL